jgi:hypothetical protein
MAIGASTVWRVRVGGNDANGAGYDSTIASAGTDYSQQDAAQLSLTDIVCAASTTVTSATGGFTAAMIGNAIRLTGSGVTSGYYFITARTNTNTITVDRNPAAGATSGGTGKVGGAAATTDAAIFLDANSSGNKLVSGNTVYIRGAGTDTPSSADYTISSRLSIPAGTTSACVRIIGENGRPYLDSTTDITFLNCIQLLLSNVLIKGSHAAMAAIVYQGTGVVLKNCTLKLNNKGFPVFLTPSQCSLINSEVDGGCTGAVSLNSVGDLSGNGNAVIGCYIHDVGGIGISCTGNGWSTIMYNIIKKPWGVGISFGGTSGPNVIAHNTIDNGQSDGIVLTSQAIVTYAILFNNIVSNCSQSGKTGLKVTSGTAATSDGINKLIDYNCIYNCTTAYSGISAGAHDISTDPQYSNQSSGDYRLGSASPCKAAGFPGQILNAGSNMGYVDIGALQRQESGGSSGSAYTFIG